MDRVADLLDSQLNGVSTSTKTNFKPTESDIPNKNSKINFSNEDFKELWEEACHEISKEIDQQLFNTWIKVLKISNLELPLDNSKEAKIELTAPNKFSCAHIEKNYQQLIADSFSKLLLVKIKLHFCFDKHFSPANDPLLEKTATSPILKKKASLFSENRLQKPDETNLNPKYNFSNFVVGSCNQFAHAVSLKVAESPGTSFNPLFVYGGVGLGKTHLANAIGNSTKRQKKKVLLVSSENFVSELIASIRSNKMDSFKSKFRSLDLLIVDDIQFIIGKERTQEEFFHTFNELYNKHKQIIITSDKMPNELIGLEDRLKTRFASGLSVDLQSPDYETRVAIIVNKAVAEKVNLPEEVARLLACNITSNVRELEGAVNRLFALSSVNKTSIDLKLAEDVISSLSLKKKTKEINFELVKKIVAEHFNVSLNDILGKRRTQHIAAARHVCMYFCRKLTNYSYPEIGAYFGGRDHCTAIHAYKVVVEKLTLEKSFSDELEKLENKITS